METFIRRNKFLKIDQNWQKISAKCNIAKKKKQKTLTPIVPLFERENV